MTIVNLWRNEDASAWRSALKAYPERITSRAVSRLPDLDAWYRQELPKLLMSRSPAYVTKPELIQVTEWKMKRGVYRARNLVLVKDNPEAQVEQTSRAAFSAIPDLRKPWSILCELSGVGPATASAILAAVRPDLYPFFDEDVARQIPGLGKVAFTPAYYARYADALRARAQQMSQADGGRPWSADGLAQALWAVAPPGTGK